MWSGDDKPGERFGWPRSTLTEIERKDWGEPTFDSGLVIRCHRLRTIQLWEWTVDDLRCMLGQQISLSVIMPLALDVLEYDPFAGETTGSLLAFALKADRAFWLNHLVLWQRMERVVVEVEEFERFLRSELLPATVRFRAV